MGPYNNEDYSFLGVYDETSFLGYIGIMEKEMETTISLINIFWSLRFRGYWCTLGS